MTTENFEVVSISSRSESMRRDWSRRRASAAIEAEWSASPVCLCGCRGALVRRKNRKESLFIRGHHARLKSLARRVLRSEAEPAAIPEIARVMKSRLAFLLKDPELAKLF